MSFNSLIGISASIFTGISMLPQLISIIRTKKAGDISKVMLVVLASGLGLWVWYGALIGDYIIVISNAFSLLVNLLILILSIRYKR